MFKYPMSFGQKRIWFLFQYSESKTLYNISRVLSFEGHLKIEYVREVFELIIARHEILRTTFRFEDGQPVQIISPECRLDINFEKCSEKKPAHISQLTERFIKNSLNYHFDLEVGPLMRLDILELTEFNHLISITMHHIVSDGWSMNVLVKELTELYSAKVNGSNLVLPELPIQYVDYSEWQRNYLLGGVRQSLLSYWTKTLKGLPFNFSLPTDFEREDKEQFEGNTITQLVTGFMYDEIKNMANSNHVSLHMYLFTAYVTLLSIITGDKDVVVGIPVANRKSAELEGLIGFFVNTLVIRIGVNDLETFNQLLQKVKLVTLEAFEHQDLPFEDLVSEIQVQRHASFSPLFQLFFAFQNLPKQKLEFPDIKVQSIDLQPDTAKFDLSLLIDDTGDSLRINWEYRSELYKEQTIEQLGKQFLLVLEKVILDGNFVLNQLELVSDNVKHKLLHIFNRSETGEQTFIPLISNFEQTVAKKPHQCALIFKEIRLTYRQLDELANTLANYMLDKYNPEPGQCIAICLERSEWSVITLLAVLKIGAAYVPIEIDYPEERKDFILKESGCLAIIDSNELAIFSAIKDNYPGTLVKPLKQPAELIYVLYTSGSTGRPKGVMMGQKALANLIDFHFTDTSIDCKRILQFANICFDVAFQEIFFALIGGAELYITPREYKLDYNLLANYIRKNKISTIFLPTAYLKILMRENDFLIKVSGVIKDIITAGEKLVLSDLFINYLRDNKITLHNHYGPTETHVVTTLTINGTKQNFTNIPTIGRPIKNVAIYILNKNKHLVPEGGVGEICVGGIALAKGYLNNPTLTAEKFVINPFDPETKLYMTGDFGRWLPDGTIEFTGRKDEQVKINGFRVELSEVEFALLNLQEVKMAAVIASAITDSSKELIAYITLNDNSEVAEVRQKLRQKLPEYMIPLHFIVVHQMPLNKNGKIDKVRLPEAQAKPASSINNYCPDDEIELQVLSLWRGLLDQDTIGPDDGFFESGGHSLKIMQLIGLYSKHFSVVVSVQDLFRNKTIPEHARLIRNAVVQKYSEIEVAVTANDYPVSDAQKRLWIISQIEEASRAYHLPVTLSLVGTLDVGKFKEAILNVIQRHEILRTVFFKKANGEIRQRILNFNDMHFTIAYFDVTIEATGNDDVVKQYIKKNTENVFELDRGPLIRVGIIKHGQNEHTLFFNAHHIICDQHSFEILLQEIAALYKSGLNDTPLSLPLLPIQYKDYAVWLSKQKKTNNYFRQSAYWRTQFKDAVIPLDLQRLNIYGRKKAYNGKEVKFVIDAGLFYKMRRFYIENNGSLFMLLLTGLKVILFRYTQQTDITIGSPFSGRIHPGLQNQVGFYVNTLALRTLFKTHDSFYDVFEKIKQTVLNGFENGEYSYNNLIEDLELHYSPGQNPLFDLMLVLKSGTKASGKYPLQSDTEIKITQLADSFSKSNFDITFSFEEGDGELTGKAIYDVDLFESWYIEQLCAHLVTMLDQALTFPGKSISEINYITEHEKLLFLNNFNRTKVSYPNDKTITELFEEQVLKNPETIALKYERKQFSYRSLNEESNRFAAYLKSAHHLQPNEIVAVKLQRSEWTIITLLAILKSGSAYLPIDPEYPEERILYMLSDSGVLRCIDNNEIKKFIDLRQRYLSENPSAKGVPSDLAYVNYTSGSTGMPKGVKITNKNVVSLVKGQNYFAFSETNKLLSTGAFSFDAVTFEYWGMLLNGGTLVLCDQSTLMNVSSLKNKIREEQINVMWFTSGWFNQLIDEDIELFGTLSWVLAGGDILSPKHINKLRVKYPDIAIVNGYGPTENTTFSLCHKIEKTYQNIPIGKPLNNRYAYVLDSHMQPVPLGVYGEIYLAGDGISEGYINNPKLTTELFKNFEWNDEIVYKTGDIGKWLPDGTMLFAGRKDSQIKIRGNRVELAEIEKALFLFGNNALDKLIVIAKTVNSEKRLVAYFTSNQVINKSSLREFLKTKLPAFSIPDYFVCLPVMPLTENGKIDRNNLPDVSSEDLVIKEYIAPRNFCERELEKLFSELLKTKELKFGIKDDFFELGGNSLKVIMLIASINRVFSREIKVSEIYTNSSIEKLSELIEQKSKTLLVDLVPTDKLFYKTTPVQKRIYFLDQTEGGKNYLIPLSFEIDGISDSDKIVRVFANLTAIHKHLLTNFALVEGLLFQKINTHAPLPIFVTDADGKCVSKLTEPFNLLEDILFRVFVVKTSEFIHRIHLVIHHILCDGKSLEILIRDFKCLLQNQDVQRNELQYTDYSEWFESIPNQLQLKKYRNFWLAKIKPDKTGNVIPLDYARETGRGEVKSVKVNIASFRNDIKDFLSRTKTAASCFFLSAFILAVKKLYSVSETMVGIDVLGRNIPALENCIGMFVNNVVLYNKITNEDSSSSILSNVQQTLIEAIENQDYQFDELVKDLNLKRGLRGNPIFQVMYNVFYKEENTNHENLPFTLTYIGDTVSREAKFDLVLSLTYTVDNFALNLEYDANLFKQQTISELAVTIEGRVTKLLTDPSGLTDVADTETKNVELTEHSPVNIF